MKGSYRAEAGCRFCHPTKIFVVYNRFKKSRVIVGMTRVLKHFRLFHVAHYQNVSPLGRSLLRGLLPITRPTVEPVFASGGQALQPRDEPPPGSNAPPGGRSSTTLFERK